MKRRASGGATRPPVDSDAQGDVPEAVDGEGQPVDCARCAHASKRDRAPCQIGHACVQDRYARRVDRFFRWNPDAADAWLGHPYFEVRAIYVRHATIFRLTALMTDPDETVRASVALRLPQKMLVRMAKDPHREVRIRVAQRLAPRLLTALCCDDDYGVRTWVARRLPPQWLSRMAGDPDDQVRQEVARRVQPALLEQLAGDEDLVVRRLVAERAGAALLRRLAKDPAWEVRWEVARRADRALAGHLAKDVEQEVRMAAGIRLAALGSAEPPQDCWP